MTTQITKATQELSDTQLDAVSGGCYKRHDDDCYEERYCEPKYDDCKPKYCSDDYDNDSCNYEYRYNDCHERRRRHHGCNS